MTGVITAWERLRSKNLSTRAYFLIFIVSFSVAGFFMAWREQFERAEIQAKAETKTPQPAIQVTVPPAQVVVMPNTPSQLPTESLSQPKLKERARLHIVDYELLADDRNFVTLNLFVHNTGTVSADMRTYHASVVFAMQEDQEAEKKLEADAEAKLGETIRDLQKKHQSTPINTVLPGPPGIWFTHRPGISFTEEQFKQFLDRKIMVYFAGLLEYSDDSGTHETYYCAANNGSPTVIFQCHGLNQEL